MLWFSEGFNAAFYLLFINFERLPLCGSLQGHERQRSHDNNAVGMQLPSQTNMCITGKKDTEGRDCEDVRPARL